MCFVVRRLHALSVLVFLWLKIALGTVKSTRTLRRPHAQHVHLLEAQPNNFLSSAGMPFSPATLNLASSATQFFKERFMYSISFGEIE
jgi:hypothetical protein